MNSKEEKRLKITLIVIGIILIVGLCIWVIWAFFIQGNQSSGNGNEVKSSAANNEDVSGNQQLVTIDENQKWVLVKEVKYVEQEGENVEESTTTYSYDDKGREYQSICKTVWGEETKTEHQFDDNENSVLYIQYDENGTPHKIDKTTYNQQGNKAEYTVYDENDAVVYIETYSYDINEHLTEITTHKEGFSDYTEYFAFNEVTNTFTSNSVNRDVEISYNGKGRILYTKEKKDDETYITEYSYDDYEDRSIEVQMNSIVKDGKTLKLGGQGHCLDENGVLIGSWLNDEYYRSTYSEEYQYDINGNIGVMIARDGNEATISRTEYTYELIDIE